MNVVADPNYLSNNSQVIQLIGRDDEWLIISLVVTDDSDAAIVALLQAFGV